MRERKYVPISTNVKPISDVVATSEALGEKTGIHIECTITYKTSKFDFFENESPYEDTFSQHFSFISASGVTWCPVE